MDELTNFEKLDAILKYLDGRPKSVEYDAEEIRNDLDKQYKAQHFPEIGDLLIFLDKEGMIFLDTSSGKFMSRIITPGSLFINAGGYVTQEIKRGELEKLNKEKLMVDISNAEKVYKSYGATRVVAWLSLIVSVAAIILRVLESNHIWPFRK